MTDQPGAADVNSPGTWPALEPGDWTPRFYARASNNPRYCFDSVAGRYIVLSFLGSAGRPEIAGVLRDIVAGRARFDDRRAAFFGVSVDPADEGSGRVRQSMPGLRFFWDFDGAVSRRYGALAAMPPEGVAGRAAALDYRPFSLVLDPLLRVIANLPYMPFESHADRLFAVLDRQPPVERYPGVDITAPVLLLPRILSDDLCRRLIAAYQANGGTESGFMQDRDGKTIAVIDAAHKRRQDYTITEEALRRETRLAIERHLVPLLRHAFQFDATYIERYIVACYNSETGGYFNPHRDNSTKATAHRRFAVTINLNAEDYEGGDLCFPEFGPRTYRAPTGGAVVFSCGMLHQALPVTAGVRYAFLPFLYDQAAAAIRHANIDFLSETVERRETAPLTPAPPIIKL